MKKKKYFWNQKHHRLLDLKMGLLKLMPEPIANLASACGMSPYLTGTIGLRSFCIFTNKKQDINRTYKMDVRSKDYQRTFLQATALTPIN